MFKLHDMVIGALYFFPTARQFSYKYATSICSVK